MQQPRHAPGFMDADFVRDSAQAGAARHLHRVYREIVGTPANNEGVLDRLVAAFRKPQSTPVKGLYMWGGVGRGKTYLMDSFYEALPVTGKMRVHFHRFMHKVHADLRDLDGEQNPLAAVTARFASEARIVCFDEFYVSDIADAMIMAGFLEHFFAHGLTLIATSNIAPDDLYQDGLQRARFLPAIELLKQHTEVVNVDGGVDYRLRALQQADIYCTPIDEQTGSRLDACFDEIATETGTRGGDIEVEGRNIPTLRCAHGVVWFDFDAICGGPRSKDDYIEISRCYYAVLVSDIPVFQKDDDRARRFISLIDEFYDRNVKLIASAAAAPVQLYQSGRLAAAFERTASRLIEMQAPAYLAQQHMP